MPDTFSILSKTTKEITGQLTTELPGEIILNPQPAIIKIQGGDGLHEWNQVLLNNPHFVSYEKDGIQHGKGYVELTSELKISFEFPLLPEDSWRVIRGQTFSAV
jgi:hypothetical protein